MTPTIRRRAAAGLLLFAVGLIVARSGGLAFVGLRPQAIAKPTFVLIDRVLDRANSEALQSLGPESREWAAIRKAGGTVFNVDADSSEAKAYAKQIAAGVPCILTFDGERLVSVTKVESIRDVPPLYQRITGRRLEGP